MPFTSSTNLTDPLRNVAGEDRGLNNITLSSDTFEDGLIVGRFAKLDSGSLDNLDSSATPNIAGVVLRSAANAIEDGQTYDATLIKQVEYTRSGLVTIDVVAGQAPTAFGPVFASNTDDANRGKGTTVDDATTEATNAEWIEEVASDVWLIRLV